MKVMMIINFQILILMSYIYLFEATLYCPAYPLATPCPVACFNNVCYSNGCPEKTQIDPLSDNKECICKYKYYINTGSPPKLVCLEKDQPCPTTKPYFYDGYNECSATDCGSYYTREIVTLDGSINYQCVTACSEDEVMTTFSPKKCLKTCKGVINSGTKYEYYYPTVRNCVSSCGTDFTYEEKGTCHSKCETTLNIVNPSATSPAPKYLCTDKTLCSETGFNYLVPYTNSCVKQCSDTSDDKIKLTTTYAYEESSTNIKKCVTDCSLTSKPYHCIIDSPSSKTCTNDCSTCTAKNIIGTDGKCISSCSSYTIVDLNKCVTTCPSDYFTDETVSTNKKCYKQCPVDKYYKYNTKNCVSFNRNNNEFIVLGDNSRTLYTKCPSFAPYYSESANNDAKHVCFSSTIGCSDEKNPDSNYIYSSNSDPYQCLNKCPTSSKRRTENFICLDSSVTKCPDSYPYNNNTVCYKNGCPEKNMDYYIDSETGEKICYTTPTCPSGFKYLQEGKCVKECDKINFPLKIESTGTGSGLVLGYCFQTAEGCFNKGYYYIDEMTSLGTIRICSKSSCKTTSNKVIQNEPGTTHPYQRDLGTCVSSCPVDYPYIGTDSKCYKEECPDNQYSSSSNSLTCVACSGSGEIKYKKQCVTSCPKDSYKFYYGGTNECVEKCPIDKKFYSTSDYKCSDNCGSNAYNPLTFECLSSCLGVKDYLFFPKSTSSTNPMPCQSSCNDGEFYKDDDKKCSSSCSTNLYSSSDPKKCVSKCETGESVGTDNRCKSNCETLYYVKYSSSYYCCTSKDDCQTKGHDTSLTVYTNSTHLYLAECPIYENYQLGDVCYPKCPSTHPYYEKPDSSKELFKCVTSCKSANSKPLNIKDGYECLDTCPTDRAYIQVDMKVCLEECPKEYPFYYKVNSGDSYSTCYKACPNDGTVQYKASDYHCVAYCSENNYKPYYYKENNTCLAKCPDDVPYYDIVSTTVSSVAHYYFQCKSHCDANQYLAPNNSCGSNCPDYAPYIGRENKCKKVCDAVIDGSYYKKKTTTALHQVYQCLVNCQSDTTHKYKIYNTSECLEVASCSGKYISPDNICYTKCYPDPKYPFSATKDDSSKVCSDKCLGTTYINYLNDKVCISGCSSDPTNKTIDENKACVAHCHYDNPNSIYKFELNNKCSDSCGTLNYIKTDYKCISQCTGIYLYIRQTKECSTSCDLNSTYKFANLKASGTGEYECKEKCDTSKPNYYESDYICHANCQTDHSGYNNQEEGKCVNFCEENTDKKYLYKPGGSGTNTYTQNTCVKNCITTNRPYTQQNKECSDKCDFKNYIYYLDSDKICLDKCPEGTNTEDVTHKCVTNCPTSHKFLTDNKECKSACDTTNGFIYYFESDYICRKSCENFYVNPTTHICSTSCPDFAYDNECVTYCNNTKPYYIKTYEQGEVNVQKKCLTDCPVEYPYAYLISSPKVVYECFANCSFTDKKYFVSSLDPLKTAKECLSACNTTYNYIGTNNECLKKCPDSLPFYTETTVSNIFQCYKTCPNNYAHEINSYKCITYKNCKLLSTTENYFIDYDTKLCVERCSINQNWGKKTLKDIDGTTDVELKFCLNGCIDYFGLLITPELQCVTTCSDNVHILDETKKKCLCKNLYYINEITGVQTCIDSVYNYCISSKIGTTVVGDTYKFNVEGTKECVSICNTTSTMDNICLKKNSTCPNNTYLYNYPDGSSVCKCLYKYYTDAIGNGICLTKYSNCPSTKPWIIIDTKECQSSCPTGYKKLVNQFCVKDCPNGFPLTGDECKCAFNWYKELNEKQEYTFTCLTTTTNCLDKHPFLKGKETDSTFECVDKCRNNIEEEENNAYDKLFGTIWCIDVCPTGTSKTYITSNDPLFNYTSYVCRCNNLWYNDLSQKNGVTCSSSDTSKYCGSLNIKGLNYQIKEKRECVEKCPDTHPYYFNFECFTSCEQGRTYGYDIKKVEGSFECTCSNVWTQSSWDSSDSTNPTKMVKTCKAECVSGELEIKSTEECITATKCPDNYPLRFNDECYAMNKCPENSHYDSTIANKCVCDNLWYYLSNNKIYCMGKNDIVCPISDSNIKYHSITKKQCTNLAGCKSTTDSLYKFNLDCYDQKCPDTTIETSTSSHECKCDEEYGYWYEEIKDTETQLVCGIKSCPADKPNVIEGTKQCVHDCSQANGKKYQGVKMCYSSGCPPKTYTPSDTSTNVVFCRYRDLSDSTNKNELVQFASEDLSLYYTNDTTTDYIFSKHNVNLQIYGINKKNISNAELLRKADLSYIDFSKCINKLYTTNGLTNDENIIVVKYDILDSSKNYMINSVEYELFSSKTYKKIDSAVCDAKSIIVSYPVSYTITKYDGEENTNYNKYKKIFNLAKELHETNSEYDVYNYTSPIYTDPCITCEIDGKDLVLEDRADYLYPSVSTCENNCSFYKTDYDLERVNCLCSPKENFDINRNQPIINYNFSIDEIKDNQGGSSNLPVLKCLDKLDEKDKILKNGGFYYMTIATGVQIILVCISAFVGYSKSLGLIGSALQVNTATVANPPPKDEIKIETIPTEIKYIDSKSNLKDDNNRQKVEQNVRNNNRSAKSGNNHNPINSGEEGLITIKKISPDKKRSLKNERPKKMALHDIKEDDQDNDSENSSNDRDVASYESLYNEIKNEQRMIRFTYQRALRVDNNSSMTMILASILDKIYFTRTLFFLKKFDILSAYISLYVIYHVSLLTFIAFFFDVETIKKIWNKKSFPGIDWYLLYGFIANAIAWVLYIFLSCLLSNNDKVENLLALKYDVSKREFLQNRKGLTTDELLNEKYQKVVSDIKTKLIIYYILCFVLIIFSFIYLTVFCAIYTGTKKRVFIAYGISLIEILIIKIVYGIILGALRKASIDSKIKCLYKFVKVCNVYLS